MFQRNLIKVRVPAHQIYIGMYICELDRPWLGTPFPLQGFRITSAEEVKQLTEICEYIYIDVRKSKLSKHDSRVHIGQKSVIKKPKGFLARLILFFRKIFGRQNPVIPLTIVYQDKVSVVEEQENARKAYTETKAAVNDILCNFQRNKKIDINQAKRVVDSCVCSLLNNKDSLLWFTLIKNKDKYTSEHCLNVSILTIAFGRHLGLPEEELQNLGLCGLLHDIGKVKIATDLLNKDGYFTKEEFELMKLHTTYGKEYLVEQEYLNHDVIDAAFLHHERIDGTGYPCGLSDWQIPYYAKIIAITDAYDAITSDRAYQNSRTTLQAQKILYEATGSHFDVELVQSYIQFLGIYPPGSVIEMSNGEAGIVLSVNQDFKLKPKIMLLVDEGHQPHSHRLVDLSIPDLDRHGNVYQIKTSHPNKTYGIDVVEYQQSGFLIDNLDDKGQPKQTVSDQLPGGGKGTC